MGTMIELRSVTKHFGTVRVLEGLSFAIPDGSFTSLLGASGSGKTTALNLIGGLDQPTAGEILIAGAPVFSDRQRIDVPTERRSIGYVFQSYALWPHMRVLDIVAYPLRVRGVAKAERYKAAEAILERLELGDLGARYPFELSGGQQQRVAIARSLVYHPRLLLLDEPLSNLDAQLRERAKAWLAKVHAEFELTTVLVTHDQVEALSLSDHVILLRDGKIEQSGPAKEIYETPRTAYVADFVGGANTYRGRVESSERLSESTFQTKVKLTDAISFSLLSPEDRTIGADVQVAIRPQRLRIVPSEDAPRTPSEIVLPLTVNSSLYRGNDWEVLATSPIGEMRIFSSHAPEASASFVLIDQHHCHCLLD